MPRQSEVEVAETIWPIHSREGLRESVVHPLAAFCVFCGNAEVLGQHSDCLGHDLPLCLAALRRRGIESLVVSEESGVGALLHRGGC